MKIALIGTGMIGEGMGGRLLDAHHLLAVWRLMPAAVAASRRRQHPPSMRRPSWSRPRAVSLASGCDIDGLPLGLGLDTNDR